MCYIYGFIYIIQFYSQLFFVTDFHSTYTFIFIQEDSTAIVEKAERNAYFELFCAEIRKFLSA